MCKTCNGRHPSSFNDDSQRYVDKNTNQENSESNSSNPISHCIEICNMKGHVESVSHPLVVLVWLHHKDSPDKKIMVYALLDDQSDACFVTEETLKKLEVDGPEIRLKLRKNHKSDDHWPCSSWCERKHRDPPSSYLHQKHPCMTQSNSQTGNSAKVAAPQEDC